MLERNYIAIQDFEITDCNKAINITDNSHDVIVKRTYMHECTRNGIYFGTGGGENYNLTVGGSYGQGNVIKNIGQDIAGADIVMCNGHDVIINYNNLYADNSNYGIDGIVPTCGGSHDILIENNSIHGHNATGVGEDGVGIKNGSHNIIIRYNYIYNNDKGTSEPARHTNKR